MKGDLWKLNSFVEFLVGIFISMLVNTLTVFQSWDKRMQPENKLR